MVAAGSWILVVILYLALWWAIILLVNTLRISAETAALALVSAWALVSLILPALITAIAQITYPPPSRFEQIATARAAEIAATTQWANDHKQAPEGNVAGAIADMRQSVAIAAKIEAAVGPINAQFDDRLAQQQRFVAALSLLAPAQIAGDALAASAGTDSGAALAFRRSAADYLDALQAPLVRLANDGKALTAAAYAAVPSYAPPPPRSAPLAAIAYLAVATGITGTVAARRFSRLRLG